MLLIINLTNSILHMDFFSALKKITKLIGTILFSQKCSYEGMLLIGDPGFCDRIKNSIGLIKDTSLESFVMLRENISIFVKSEKHHLTFDSKGAALALDAHRMLENSDVWIASILVCEAYRAMLYHQYKKKHIGAVPKEIYSGREILEKQYETLQKIGASFEELKYLADFVNEC